MRQRRNLIDDLAAYFRERLGLGARAVPDRNVVAGLQQPLGHREAHAAHADPTDLLRVLRHNELLAHANLQQFAPRRNPLQSLAGSAGWKPATRPRILPAS